MARTYAVDTASYNSANLTSYHNHGAKDVLVKVSEGTGYFNPKASAQIKSAHDNHMYVHGYHFALFGNSVSQAKAEAKFFVHRAEYLNISKKRYLPLDWETGDGNVVTGSKYSNTKAILAFMKVVHDAGYKVMLYSSASLMRTAIDTEKVARKYGTCLWVAAYPYSGATSKPDFNYFPSMNGVALWQFTDNWCGLNVDGNISLINLHPDAVAKKKVVAEKTAKKSEPKVIGIAYAPIINGDPKWSIKLIDDKGHYKKDEYIPTNSNWKVFATKTLKGMKCYKLGTNQWAPAKFFKMK